MRQTGGSANENKTMPDHLRQCKYCNEFFQEAEYALNVIKVIIRKC